MKATITSNNYPAELSAVLSRRKMLLASQSFVEVIYRSSLR
jgi:hypothetical protein